MAPRAARPVGGLRTITYAQIGPSTRTSYETWDSRGLVDRLLELAALPIQDLR